MSSFLFFLKSNNKKFEYCLLHFCFDSALRVNNLNYQWKTIGHINYHINPAHRHLGRNVDSLHSHCCPLIDSLDTVQCIYLQIRQFLYQKAIRFALISTKTYVVGSFFVCLCWGFTAQSTQWGHVERGLWVLPEVPHQSTIYIAPKRHFFNQNVMIFFLFSMIHLLMRTHNMFLKRNKKIISGFSAYMELWL